MSFLRKVERRASRETTRVAAQVLDPLLRRVLRDSARRDVHDLYVAAGRVLHEAAQDPAENAEAVRMVAALWRTHGIETIGRAIRRGMILIGPDGALFLRSTPASAAPREAS